MSAPEENKVVHVYDDIEEEDNHLPRWWLFILYATMVFSVGYWFVYHTADLRPTPNEAYRARVEALLAEQAAAGSATPETVLALAGDPAALEQGAEVFRSTCAACHGQLGEGLVGPNLTDRYWIHGAGPEKVLAAIDQGFPEKGMPPWGAILGPDRTAHVAAYVLSLEGTDVPGKEPQGELVE